MHPVVRQHRNEQVRPDALRLRAINRPQPNSPCRLRNVASMSVIRQYVRTTRSRSQSVWLVRSTQLPARSVPCSCSAVRRSVTSLASTFPRFVSPFRTLTS